ncbi:inositol monophosphatase 1 [Pectinophora gossypiella]|uniref:inositol monophosphatase 1 n=1 Tax=Pectinophora gossypiella TaxID=13191 RepID=UPI00214F5562|nr:inositol monophosphatase 1 [Pectinophora gossypiella]
MSDEIDEYFDTALALVKSAGNLMTEHVGGCKTFELKSCAIDLVTEVDKNVEKTLIEGLSKKYPSHKFIGEESVADGVKCILTDAPTWIIDPVDGTMNFVHGFPHSCISLGLSINKEVVAGIIYNPLLQQLFTAKKGKGAFLNDRQIHVSKITALKDALVTFEAGTSSDEEKRKVVFENFQRIIKNGHGVRALGSAALNMAMVALGGADANFEFGIHAWDIAAGDILVREAGGVVIDPSGGPLDILSRRVLCASTKDLAEELSKTIVQYYPERD